MDALKNHEFIIEPSAEVRRYALQQRAREAAESASTGVLLAWGVQDRAAAGRAAARVVRSLQAWNAPATAPCDAGEAPSLQSYARRGACLTQQWITNQIDAIAARIGGDATRPHVVQRFCQLLATEPAFLESLGSIEEGWLHRFADTARPVAPPESRGSMPPQPLAQPILPRLAHAVRPPRVALGFAFRSVRSCFGLL
ncbi:hypothetical protein Pla175_25490 [Pirellulimonas nuda]|uniref:Uncharacterized protein n=1 Tax=Pirellulimonas nuda TaxID=2528009 RepID=A0A518DCF3_9BACT|nr:hypothetical protein [Pirellulimonas nuda]QDU89162.1 hypothetical protein Pla175_25490 [Pirellulimonas nuda]